jgi:acetyl-CoA carboxylase biotin carboxyl carrier protein
MAVEDVQQLLDLLELSPEVSELTVQGASGNKITIKRALSIPESVPAIIYSDEDTVEQSEESAEEPETRPLSVNAALVGLFHEANPPIVPGMSIAAGQIVGYIESMRLMNEVVSSVAGTVEAAVTTEGQPVEYGQALFSVIGR